MLDLGRDLPFGIARWFFLKQVSILYLLKVFCDMVMPYLDTSWEGTETCDIQAFLFEVLRASRRLGVDLLEAGLRLKGQMPPWPAIVHAEMLWF